MIIANKSDSHKWLWIKMIDLYWWMIVNDWLIFIDYYWFYWLIFIDWWWLLMIILLCYVSVVCINGGSGQQNFSKTYRKLMLSSQKLWMNTINSARKWQVLYFSKKIKGIKKI